MAREMDGCEVLTGELDAHAGKVDAFTERFAHPVDAARQVTMNDSAYGVVCQPFALLLQPFEEMGVRTVQQVSTRWSTPRDNYAIDPSLREPGDLSDEDLVSRVAGALTELRSL